jgi:hypothetical protein
MTKITLPADTDTNRPALITAEQLAIDFGYLLGEVDGLEKQAATAPTVIEDEDDLGVINRAVVDIRGKIKAVKDKKDFEKRPFIDANSILEGFFAGLKTRLEKAQADLEARGKRYLDKKRAAEQARLAEIERKNREEAKRKADEAAAAAADARPVQAAVANSMAQAAEQRADEAAERQEAKPAELARTRTDAGTATLAEVWGYRIDAFAMIDLEMLRPYFVPADVEKAIRKFVSINKDSRPLPGVTIFRDTKASFR